MMNTKPVSLVKANESPIATANRMALREANALPLSGTLPQRETLRTNNLDYFKAYLSAFGPNTFRV